jgi:hypothetical protein
VPVGAAWPEVPESDDRRPALVRHTFDVGGNAVGAWLGDGWYRGRLGWRGGFRHARVNASRYVGLRRGAWVSASHRPPMDRGINPPLQGRMRTMICLA